MLDTFTAQLMVQCSRQRGLGAVVSSAIGFEGSEFYIGTVPPHLVGHSFHEASFHYPNALLIGSMVEDSSGKQYCDFGTPGSYKLKAEEEVVFLTEDAQQMVALKAPCTQLS